MTHPALCGAILGFDRYAAASRFCRDIGEQFDLNKIGTLKSRATIIHTEASFNFAELPYREESDQ